MKFLVAQNPEGKCSFTLVNDADETVLKSVLFADRDSCVAAIRTLTRTLPDSGTYKVVADGGSFFYETAVDGAAVARSEAFDSETEAQEALDLFTEDTSDETQYRVELTTTSSNTAREQLTIPTLGAIDYDSLYDFGYASPKGTSGLEQFVRDGKDHYFHFNDANGQALLYSRSFDSGFKRDKRVRQVIAASAKDQRYEIIEKNGLFYFILKERNNQEIARSRTFESRADAATAMGFVQANAPALAAQFPEPTKRKSVNQYNDNLLATNTDAGFEAIKGDDKANYFILKNAAGAPILLSQGYSGAGARDSGIRTVIKNGFIPARYERKEANGKYSFVLRAGNRQEVARSVAFDSAEERDAAISWIENSVRNYATQYGITERDITTTTTESFVIDMPTPAAPVAAVGALAASALATKSAANHDEYLDCDAYKNREETPIDDFVTFKNEADGLHYFAMLNDKKEVLFRSESYPDTGSRNNGLKSVQTNRDVQERYKIIEEDNQHFVVLRAANNREIARSCPFESQAALFGLFPWLQTGEATGGFPWSAAAAGLGVLGLAGTASAARMAADVPEIEVPATEIVATEEAQTAVPVAAIAPAIIGAAAVATGGLNDNYLDCDLYKKHNDTLKDGFVKFRSNADGQHYFAMLNNKKEVLFRSEGYAESGARNNGIKIVKDNRDNKNRYETIEENDQQFVILKTANGREIARSCPIKDKAGVFALFPWLAAGFVGAFPWAAAAAATGGAAAVGATGMAAASLAGAGAAAGGAAVGATGAAAGGAAGAGAVGQGCMRWLPWLLGALLLAALLWWLLKGCAKPTPAGAAVADTTAVVGNGSANGSATITPVASDDSLAANANKPNVAAGTTAAALACDCAAQTDPVFNLNRGLTAKVVLKLGSNPEFGNSHGLTPTQFYEKISAKFKTNDVDKKFLNRIFKAMGYANGFKDANAGLFTDVVVPKGTIGNLGYNKLHKTQYSELQPNNTEAFRIKAANGCDLHFMKTCGNHFFYCEK